jgi:hypothetical protein
MARSSGSTQEVNKLRRELVETRKIYARLQEDYAQSRTEQAATEKQLQEATALVRMIMRCMGGEDASSAILAPPEEKAVSSKVRCAMLHPL